MRGSHRLLEPAPLAAPGTLAADFAAGGRTAAALFPPSALGRDAPSAAARPARLPASAFGTRGPATARKLERILEGEGVLVTTGQQPLLFLGPLYVLYKSSRAIETARRIEEEHGIPALACFWIASDDADWEEISRAAVLGSGDRLTEYRLDPGPGRAGRPVGPSPLPPEVEPLRESFLEALGDTEFVPLWAEKLRRAWRPGTTYAGAFASLLADTLGDRELAWLDSASAEVRAAARPLLARALSDPEVAEAVAAGTRAVERAGYPPQLTEPAGGTPVLVDTPEGRRRVYADRGTLRAGREGPRRSLEETLAELDRDPGPFSPSASLRPALESSLLPVAATVLGPGEIGYWAQLRPLFDLLGVPMPRVVPRGAWWVVEAKVHKVLDKLGAAPSDFADGGEELTRRLVEAGRPGEVEEALDRLREGVRRGLEGVEAAVQARLPGIRSAVGKASAGFEAALHELERTVDARVRERQEILLRQVRRAAAHLFPGGKPQERVLSPFEYLTRYGPALVEELEGRERELARGAGAGVAGPAGPP